MRYINLFFESIVVSDTTLKTWTTVMEYNIHVFSWMTVMDDGYWLFFSKRDALILFKEHGMLSGDMQWFFSAIRLPFHISLNVIIEWVFCTSKTMSSYLHGLSIVQPSLLPFCSLKCYKEILMVDCGDHTKRSLAEGWCPGCCERPCY